MAGSGEMTPAIVLSGHTVALGVVRALGVMGVPVVVIHYDDRDIAHLSKYCCSQIVAPRPEEAENEFVDLLTNCASRFGGGVVFPVSDETVVVVARHKRILDRHYTVACPEWEVVRRFIDKKRTYALAEVSGVSVPKSFVPSSLEEAEEIGRQLGFPCLVKPCQSHIFYARFHRKMFPVRNVEEMLSIYRQALRAGLEVMLQEIIPGDDAHVVNYNAYFCQGAAALEFTAEHVRNAPPMWGSPRVAVSKDVPDVIEPGRKILRAMGFEGYACTEFKKDARDGIYKLMDVNGRHNLSTLLAVGCGVNFPWLHYKHLVSGELPATRRFRRGVYWIDLTRDVAYSVRYVAKERYSPLRYIRPYCFPHVFAIFDLHDFTPFVKRCTFLTRVALRTLVAPIRRCCRQSRRLKPPLHFVMAIASEVFGRCFRAAPLFVQASVKRQKQRDGT